MSTPGDLHPLPAYLWQVALHSWVLGFILYVWVRRAKVPSGRTKRFLLVLLLALPLVTAAIPGRAGIEFGERIAWFNSWRILAVPLGARFHLYHLVLLISGLSILLTLWQELTPWHARPRTIDEQPPESLVQMARSLPGWEQCRVILSPAESIVLASGGGLRRPKLIVSKGALSALSADELQMAVAHEHAHTFFWTETHALFLVRLVQCYNPVALWAFREYCLEVEVACDARAVTGREPQALARVLLKIYQSTDRRDMASRSMLRKRVDILLAHDSNDAALPPATIAAAAVVMLLVLPWIV